MKRLVIALPDVACIGCFVRELPTLRYAHSGRDGEPPGAMHVELAPPARWAELAPRERAPDGQPVRMFMICPACYGRGAVHGMTPTTAHIEEPRD